MEHTYLYRADLTLFDSGAGAPAGAAPAGGEGTGAAPQAETQRTPGRGRRGKSGELGAVVYGRQAGAAQPQESSDAGSDDTQAGGAAATAGAAPKPEDRKAQFDALISGDYKDLFDQRVQGIINRRFKETKALEGRANAAQPVLDLLSQRYGITDGDPAKLAQAIEADDAYWQEAAEGHGMTVPQYREFMKLQREIETFRQEAQRRQGENAARQQVEAWQREAEALKGEYPDFDLNAEVGNPQFLEMLKAGVPVRHAYEVMHLGDIKHSAAQQAAKQTEKQVTETIRAKGARPAENGTASASGVVVKSDPSRLTRADRAEIARRVARGEQISF